MTNSELYKLADLYRDQLRKDAFTGKSESSRAVYKTAKKLVNGLLSSCYTDDALRVEVADWFKNGGTVKLMALLKNTPYNENDLDQYAAFMTMDSVHRIGKPFEIK